MRTRNRSILAVILAAAMLLAACGGDDGDEASGGTGGGGDGAVDLPECPVDALESASGPVEVVIWHGYTAKLEETISAMAAEYNASQDKVVVRVENQGSYEELWQKYQQGVASSSLPAIAIPDNTVTQQVIDSQTVLPGQACMDAVGLSTDGLLDAAVDFYTIDDVYWPASTSSSAPLLYYNKNHFRKAGLDPEVAPTNLEELREHAQAIKDAGVVDVPIIINFSPAILEQFLTGGGIQLVDNDGGRGDGETTESNFDSPEVVEFLTWIQDMVDDGLMDVPPPIDNQFDHYLAMANQTASMTIETSTAAASIEAFLGGELDLGDIPDDAAEEAGEQAIDLDALDIGAAEVPGINGAGNLQFGGGAWYITNTTPPEVQAAAWDFVTWFNSVDNQVRWSIDGSYLPSTDEVAQDPRLQESWSSSLAGQWLAIAYEELLDGVDPDNPGPLLGPYDQFRAAERRAIEALIFEDADPAEVARQVDETTTAAIADYNDGF